MDRVGRTDLNSHGQGSDIQQFISYKNGRHGCDKLLVHRGSHEPLYVQVTPEASKAVSHELGKTVNGIKRVRADPEFAKGAEAAIACEEYKRISKLELEINIKHPFRKDATEALDEIGVFLREIGRMSVRVRVRSEVSLMQAYIDGRKS